MTHDESSKPGRAAGGLLWRRGPAGYEIALVHRARYGDWTLPKGKLESGESWRDCACREVREETGYSARLQGFAGAVAYLVEDRPKVVCYWHMLAAGEPGPRIEGEVDEVAWLPIDEARARATHPLERALLETWQSPEDEHL